VAPNAKKSGSKREEKWQLINLTLRDENGKDEICDWPIKELDYAL